MSSPTSSSPSQPKLYDGYQDPFSNGRPWNFHWLRMCFQWNGGLLQMFWIELFTATLICAILTTALYYTRLDNVDQERHPITRGLTDAVLFISRRFQAAIALMLGFYTIQCFNRWVTARSLEGAVMGKLRDLSLQIAWRIKSKQPPPAAASRKKKHPSTRKPTPEPTNTKTANANDEPLDVEQGRDSGRDSGGAGGSGSMNGHDVEYGAFNRMDVHHVDMTVEFIQLQLVRWINLAHAIVIGTVYPKPSPSTLSSTPTSAIPTSTTSSTPPTSAALTPLFQALVQQGLATHREAQFLQQQPERVRHTLPFIWCIDFLTELRDIGDNDDNDDEESSGENGETKPKQTSQIANVITDGIIGSLMGGMSSLQTSLTDIYNHKDSPLPLSYRQLVNATVRLYMILLLLAAALTETAVAPLGQLDYGSFWIILVYAFEYFLFVGWITVADAVHNPYRYWPGSYPWDEFVKAAQINCIMIAHSFRSDPTYERQFPEIVSKDVQRTVEHTFKPRVISWTKSKAV